MNDTVGRNKRRAKISENTDWDCDVCTYRNATEAYKCQMCDVHRGTSTRRARINPQLAAQKVAQHQFALLPKSHKKDGNFAATGTAKNSKPHISARRNKHPSRFKNIDPSSAETNEVTVNNVTVFITEYKPKKKKNSDNSGLSSSASSETGSHIDSNQDSISLDNLNDV